MATTKNEDSYVSRPRRKPDETVRGKLNRWDNGFAEFVPQGSKASNRTMLKQLGNSSFYKSEGAKESSYSIHVNVDGDSPNPVAEAFEVFMALTDGQRKTEPKMPEGSAGRMLLDNGGSLKVWLDSEKGEVLILSKLECSPQIDRQLLQLQAQMNVTLGRYRTEIVNAKKE